MKVTDISNPDGYSDSDTVQVLADQPLTMSCEVLPGANPAADIQWTATTPQLTQASKVDQPIVGSKLTSSSREVTFTPTLEDHISSVTCLASHSGLDAELSVSIQLDVQGIMIQDRLNLICLFIFSGQNIDINKDDRIHRPPKIIGIVLFDLSFQSTKDIFGTPYSTL